MHLQRFINKVKNLSADMGQQEVYDFLKKNKGKWFTAREISEKLNVSVGSVTNNIAKLKKNREILFKPSDRANQFKYAFKR